MSTQARYRFPHTEEIDLEDGWYVDRYWRVWNVYQGWMTLKDSDRKNKSPQKSAPFRRLTLQEPESAA